MCHIYNDDKNRALLKCNWPILSYGEYVYQQNKGVLDMKITLGLSVILTAIHLTILGYVGKQAQKFIYLTDLKSCSNRLVPNNLDFIVVITRRCCPPELLV